MSDIFNQNGAIFSDCRRYRYALWRVWDDSKGKVMFIGLNPSTANESADDPTIRRVKRFAHNWGYGGVIMLNLFTYITAYPEELMKCEDPVGPADYYLDHYAKECNKVIFAWGNFKEAEKRGIEVMQMFPYGHMLIQNKNGSPRHPLYVKADAQPIPITRKEANNAN